MNAKGTHFIEKEAKIQSAEALFGIDIDYGLESSFGGGA